MAGPARTTPEVEQALNATVLRHARAITAWVAPLMALFAPLEFVLSPADQAPRLAVADATLGLTFAAFWLALRSGRIPPRHANAFAALVCAVVVPYLAANLLVTQAPVQSAGWALMDFGAALILLSWTWLTVVLVAANLVWGVLAWQVGAAGPNSLQWQQYVFVLLAAATIAAVTHGTRLRVYRSLEAARIEERAQRQRLEAADGQARELEVAHRVNTLRAQFMNNAAHELSTPLTPIMLQLRILTSMPGATDAQRQSLSILERNLARLNALVHDLLDSARLDAQRLPLERRPVDLSATVRDAVETYQAVAAARHVKLTGEWRGAADVQGDAVRLAQVVGNLLSNAIKFTPANGAVLVRVTNHDGLARVDVEDTGLGLRSADVPALFQPFARLADGTMAADGTGLGLFISRGLVEAHGGHIGCSSPGPGLGSTFWFTLPLAQTHDTR